MSTWSFSPKSSGSYVACQHIICLREHHSFLPRRPGKTLDGNVDLDSRLVMGGGVLDLDLDLGWQRDLEMEEDLDLHTNLDLEADHNVEPCCGVSQAGSHSVPSAQMVQNFSIIIYPSVVGRLYNDLQWSYLLHSCFIYVITAPWVFSNE